MVRTSVRQIIAVALMAGSAMFASAIPSAGAATAPAARAGVAGQVVTPGIQQGSCDRQHRTWVHITFLVINRKMTQCFGGTGRQNFSGTRVLRRVCAGNNKGTVAYSLNSRPRAWHFSPGQAKSFSGKDDLLYVTINSHHGHAHC